MFTALAFLPEHRIRDVFAELKDASPTTLTEFAQHFERAYIRYFFSSMCGSRNFFRGGGGQLPTRGRPKTFTIAKTNIFENSRGGGGTGPPIPPLWIRPCQVYSCRSPFKCTSSFYVYVLFFFFFFFFFSFFFFFFII